MEPGVDQKKRPNDQSARPEDQDTQREGAKKRRQGMVPRLRSDCGRHYSFGFMFQDEELAKLTTVDYSNRPDIEDDAIAGGVWAYFHNKARRVWKPSTRALLRDIDQPSNICFGISLAHNERRATMQCPPPEIIEEIKKKLGIEKDPEWYRVDTMSGWDKV